MEKYGIDIWWEKEVDELLFEEFRNNGYIKEMDIMDVWFDLGIILFVVEIDEKLKFLYDLYLEGSD